jgi:hypothetical protein
MNGVLLIQGVKYGFDHHIWDVSLDDLTSGRFLSLVEEVTFAMSAGLTKVSALLFIWRLRGLPRDWPCLLGLFLCSLQTVAFCFLATFQCQFVLLLPSVSKILTPQSKADEGILGFFSPKPEMSERICDSYRIQCTEYIYRLPSSNPTNICFLEDENATKAEDPCVYFIWTWYICFCCWNYASCVFDHRGGRPRFHLASLSDLVSKQH